MSAEPGGTVPGLCAVLVLATVAIWAAHDLRGAWRGRVAKKRLTRLLMASDAATVRWGYGPGGRRAAVRRCVGGAGARGGRVSRWAEAVRDWWPAVGAGLAAAALTGGSAGCLIGPAVGYGVRRWMPPRRGRRCDERAAAQLPQAADLLAACLEAGAGPLEAAAAVGGSLDGPVGERLARVAAELRLGGDPAAAWGRLGELPGARGLAQALEQAQESGAPAVESVTRLAAECRAAHARKALAGASRAEVLITAPLGLCFLPGFLAVGVAPVLIGLAYELMSGA